LENSEKKTRPHPKYSFMAGFLCVVPTQNQTQRWKREPLIMKQTTRNPVRSEVNPRNTNAAYPNAMAMSICTQNALLALHVSISFSVLAIVVPAAFADNSRYANTCTATTSHHITPPHTQFRLKQLTTESMEFVESYFDYDLVMSEVEPYLQHFGEQCYAS